MLVAVLTNGQSPSQQVTAYQYYFDNDPGVGVVGNGGIINITPAASFNSTVAVPISNTLSSGLHNLFVRMQDNNGNWSIAERRSFFLEPDISNMVTAYQYYFDNDPGVGVAGNGAIVNITPTANFNSTVAVTIPNSLSIGFHNLFVRMRDNNGAWSIAERSTYITLRVFIEGFYLEARKMRAVADPVNYPLLCDTIGVELHDANAPYGLVKSARGTIDTEGYGLFVFQGNLESNRFYLSIKSRNAVETWSKLPLTIGSNTGFDFTGQ